MASVSLGFVKQIGPSRVRKFDGRWSRDWNFDISIVSGYTKVHKVSKSVSAFLFGRNGVMENLS